MAGHKFPIPIPNRTAIMYTPTADLNPPSTIQRNPININAAEIKIK
jgi:hypothetical protein